MRGGRGRPEKEQEEKCEEERQRGSFALDGRKSPLLGPLLVTLPTDHTPSRHPQRVSPLFCAFLKRIV